MKELVTKVSIRISDDGGKCDPTCPFISQDGHDRTNCEAFHTNIENMQRATQCFAREDVTYQIVGEKD